jgi:hypothetical protein
MVRSLGCIRRAWSHILLWEPASANTEPRDCFALVALCQHKLERTFALGLQSKLGGWQCSDFIGEWSTECMVHITTVGI